MLSSHSGPLPQVPHLLQPGSLGTKAVPPRRAAPKLSSAEGKIPSANCALPRLTCPFRNRFTNPWKARGGPLSIGLRSAFVMIGCSFGLGNTTTVQILPFSGLTPFSQGSCPVGSEYSSGLFELYA